MCKQDINNDCLFQQFVKDKLVELQAPISGEVYGDVITLTRNGEVIGTIPVTSSTDIFLDTFGNIIPDEN